VTYQVIPAQPLAVQSFACALDGQSAQITLTATAFGLFADVGYNGVAVIAGRLCRDRTDLNPAKYNGLPKGLFFVDQQGTSDPDYTLLGTRYLLLYGDPATESAPTYP
jgi:hypothetical protein